ncbi:MAG: PRC-barrel domain-containing protein [Chloroflexota bacterium]
MRIDLNARVRTSDGHEAGNIHRVLVDPETERITGFVISTSRLLGRDVIVGDDALAAAEHEGDVITLNLTKRDLDMQPSFDRSDFVVPPAGWSGPNLGYMVPPESFLWPAESALADTGERPRSSFKKGETVKDRDGDIVGTVEDIRFDEKTGELLSFIVRAGAGLERLFGGGKLAEISRDDILRIADGEVRLAVDREEIIPREHETRTP